LPEIAKFTKDCEICQNSRKLQKMPKFAKINQKCFNLPKSAKITKFAKFAKNSRILQKLPNLIAKLR
jgi:hypothetical protein